MANFELDEDMKNNEQICRLERRPIKQTPQYVYHNIIHKWFPKYQMITRRKAGVLHASRYPQNNYVPPEYLLPAPDFFAWILGTQWNFHTVEMTQFNYSDHD